MPHRGGQGMFGVLQHRGAPFGTARRGRRDRERRNIPWRPTCQALEQRALLSVSADFNHDGFADLAVGVPSENVGSVVNAGAVNIVYGSAEGLSPVGSQFWNQD